jgi:hypothetical protein
MMRHRRERKMGSVGGWRRVEEKSESECASRSVMGDLV